MLNLIKLKGGVFVPKNELKNRVRFSTTLDKTVNEKLKEVSKETMIPISKLLDIAIMLLIESGNEKIQGKSGKN